MRRAGGERKAPLLRPLLGALEVLLDVVFTQHTDRETRWGLRLVSWALLVQFVAILAGVSGAVFLRILALQGAAVSAFSVYAALLNLPATLLSVTSGIIFLIGFSAMYRHRGEPGSALDRNLGRSFRLLLAFIAVLVGRTVALLFLPALFPAALDPEEFQTLQVTMAIVPLGVGMIEAALLALLLYYVVVSLTPVSLLSRLRLAVVLMVVGAIITFALVVASNWTALPLQNFSEAFVAPSALAVLLFWLVYRASQRSPGLPPDA